MKMIEHDADFFPQRAESACAAVDVCLRVSLLTDVRGSTCASHDCGFASKNRSRCIEAGPNASLLSSRFVKPLGPSAQGRPIAAFCVLHLDVSLSDSRNRKPS